MNSIASIIHFQQPREYAVLAAFAGRLSERWLAPVIEIRASERDQREAVGGKLRKAL